MVEFTLTDEQRNLREMAHDFAEKEIRPVAWEYDTDGTWPGDIIEKAWEVGLMNSHIEESYGGAGAGYLDGCLIEEELSWGCSGIQTSLGCNGLATAPIALGGLGGDQEEVSGHAHRSAEARLVLPDRARRRLGRVGHAHDGRQAGRQVRDQRLEVLHHQRWLRRLLHRLREDRQGRRVIAASPRSWSSATGAWSSTRRRTSSASARRTPRRSPSTTSRSRPRTCSARKTTGSSSRWPRSTAPVPGVAAMATGIARAAFEFATDYAKRTRPVRRADRDAPGDPVHHRRHGDRDRSRAPA